jgi:hypothetical protein
MIGRYEELPAHSKAMLLIAHVFMHDLMRRSLTGAYATDPVVRERRRDS